MSRRSRDSKSIDHGHGEERRSLVMEVEGDDEIAESHVRASLDIARGNKFADARKQNELAPEYEASEMEERRSLEEQLDVDNLGLEDYPIATGLTTEQAEKILERVGPNKLPEKVTPKWKIFASQLYQPMPIMIWLAAIIELGIGNYIDGGILVAIVIGNATLSYHEITKAGDAVDALKKSLKPTAICYRDGQWDHNFDATRLVPGDLVELALGAVVPADCMINSGEVDIDESAMTGESFPASLHERQMAKMGGTVVRGETQATVVLTGKNTFFGKTAAMLNTGSGEMSNMTLLLLKIMVVLVSASIILSLICFIYLLVEGYHIKRVLSFTVVVIVASIPLAIEIVATTTLALGSREMAKFGAIVSRLAAIEDMAGMNMLCSDKTGTLTKNKMEIQEEAPSFIDGLDQMDILRYSALAAKWDTPPKDALDTLVLRCPLWWPDAQNAIDNYAREHPDSPPTEAVEWSHAEFMKIVNGRLSEYKQLDYFPFDPRIKRTESVIKNPDGTIIRITKGAPHIVAALDADTEVQRVCQDKVNGYGEDGIRSLAVAISEPFEHYEQGMDASGLVWHLAGLLTFSDPPRDDTKSTIERCQYYGCPVRMITGDHLLIAKKTCRDLEMGDMSGPNWPNIQGPEGLPNLDENGEPPEDLLEGYGRTIEASDGYAQVYPEHKYLIVEAYRRLGYKCGMTGDGVNDAPALKRADVGIAVAGATDAASAAADIVLTEEGLSTICRGIEISRIVFQRVKSFLTYRIAATLQLLIFFFVALFALVPTDYLPEGPLGPVIVPDFDEWPPFFQMPVLYLMLITLLNDGTLISVGYDNVRPSRYPEAWNLRVLFCVSIVLGAVACSSSLILLWALLDSWNPDGVFQQWGIGGVEYGQIICAMYLKIAVSDFATLISCRTQDKFFFDSRPHFILAIGASLAILCSVLISVFWPCGELDDVPVCGLSYQEPKLLVIWVLIYVFVVFFIQDLSKVLCFIILRKFNIFDINDTIIDVQMEASDQTK